MAQKSTGLENPHAQNQAKHGGMGRNSLYHTKPKHDNSHWFVRLGQDPNVDISPGTLFTACLVSSMEIAIGWWFAVGQYVWNGLEWVELPTSQYFRREPRECFSAILGPVSSGLLKRTGAMPANPSDDSQYAKGSSPSSVWSWNWLSVAFTSKVGRKWSCRIGLARSGFGFSKYLVKHTVKSFSACQSMKATNSLAASCWNECPKFPKSCNHDVRSYCVLPGFWDSPFESPMDSMKSGRNPSQKRRYSWKSWKSLLNYCWVKCPVFDNHHIQITGHHDFSYYWTSYYYFHNDIQWLFMYLHCHLQSFTSGSTHHVKNSSVWHPLARNRQVGVTRNPPAYRVPGGSVCNPFPFWW